MFLEKVRKQKILWLVSKLTEDSLVSADFGFIFFKCRMKGKRLKKLKTSRK